ncbi:hypothetical protein [Mycolicibacterium brumae]|uniref:DUF3558 domain-containing protein n=1 Tax=Mycolicibacterium brumae TaxID=85968 RepID=A0A2G5P5V6_9MYCO|nr:hypothetical protein [Mycolicibacterium brumae]MCV7191724.1 hypothetical protein [Mycolicibacterium brumae]PIB73284.1 hypothetical protein CQY22_017485 [Mycolicibacterium brumae]RWA17952.1 hypothetical protein MBRU_18185 [Mycolicibacterium brumae DSM 44177]UWW08983.1 hypothetical protein L2Z93_002062 [Mycolicibacterium brumae]
MVPVLRFLSATLLCVALITGCQNSPVSDAEPTTKAPTAVADQSAVFFPGDLADYGMTLTRTDRDHLAELYALRQIDPCGFLDGQTLSGHPDFSRTYGSATAVEPGGVGPIWPLNWGSCRVALPGSTVDLGLRLLPGEKQFSDDFYQPDPTRPGVWTSDAPGWRCQVRVELPLTALSGAPASMRNPTLLIGAMAANGGLDLDDTSLCALSDELAGRLATVVRDEGVPAYPNSPSAPERFLTADPCAAATELGAATLSWWEPAPAAQYPTSWRHANVCDLRATTDQRGPGAVVKYGLVIWSDTVLDVPWGDTATRTEQDGVELFTLADHSCLVVARLNTAAPAIAKVGANAPDMVAPTPVVVVSVSGNSGQCQADAQTIAVAAAKRAL